MNRSSFFFSPAIQQFIAIRLLPHVMPNPKKKLSKSELDRLFCPYFQVIIILNHIVSQSHDNYLLKKLCVDGTCGRCTQLQTESRF